MHSQQDQGDFQRVGVVARHHTESILESVVNVTAVLKGAGSDVVVDADTATALPDGSHSAVSYTHLTLPTI